MRKHTEALEPFTRYSLTLHTRPDKDTCDMKSVNHSESTYGTTRFYLAEGSESAGVKLLFFSWDELAQCRRPVGHILLFKAPLSGPENITFANVTLDSAGLQWTAIPEEDLRGFLLGYTIRYAEYNREGTTTTGSSRTFLAFFAATGRCLSLQTDRGR